ncbi:MAG: dihydroorotase [Eggerthellaceae bacterium]|nr:dihydroorotase [Eggerthellaceae bacterium]
MKSLIKNVRVIDPALSLDEVADILIDGQIIAQVGKNIECADAEIFDRDGCIAVPGLVDIHVHLRDPGQEYKETIETGTAAAAHGGFTGICSMPNTNPTTDNATTIDYVLDKAAQAGHCRVYPSGACTKGLKGESLSEMGDMVLHGAVAFTDDGRGVQNSGVMRRVMDYAKMFNKVVMSHCQDEDLVGPGQVNEGVVSTRLGLAGWPATGEELQIQRDIALSELTGCPIHIQHITSARGVELVREGKARGIQVTCEVTPHHLVLNEDDITTTYNTNLKMNPPLRSKADNAALIEGIKDGTIDCIVTDHAPHADHEKAREFELAPFGMTGLETSLGVILTYLVDPGLITYNELVELMAIKPREILRLDQVTLKQGSVADITIFDPEVTWTVQSDDMYSKSHNSGFLGYTLKGRATDVFVGGTVTCKDGVVVE